MRFISQSYFVGELFVPNITSKSGSVSELTEFQTFIGLKEVDYLESFFGYEMAKIIIDAYDASVAVSPVALPSRIADIITGAEFTNIWGDLDKWKGLTRADLTSPIADYVYYYWNKKNASQTTGAGEIINQVENSTVISKGEKVEYVWNKGVKQNLILADFMRSNASTYPEYPIPYPYHSFGNRRSLLTNINTFDV